MSTFEQRRLHSENKLLILFAHTPNNYIISSISKNHGKRRPPLLLLDDIFDKLDAGCMSCIVYYVSGDDFGQIFITDTNRDYRLFVVEHGQIRCEPSSTPYDETQKN